MRSLASIALAAALVLLAGQASAHAHLKTAVPAEKARLTQAPAEIALSFSEELEAAFSQAKITGPDGKPVPAGKVQLRDGGTTLVVPLPVEEGSSLPVGTYRVDWHVLSTDGHKTEGSYTFVIAPE